jgi:DNA repair photolyase
MAKRFGKAQTYEDWCEPVLVSNTLELLDKEIPKLKSKIQSVQLCFTTDPFMLNYPEIGEMSIKAIRKLNSAKINCNILTKGLLPIELSELSIDNTYGITLVSLNQEYREKYEPNASNYPERIKSLKDLQDKGCKTWVSIEPYPTPNIIEQNLIDILKAVSFTDKIIFGRTNYSKEITEYKKHKQFYNECVETVIDFCNSNNIEYYIKKGTIT